MAEKTIHQFVLSKCFFLAPCERGWRHATGSFVREGGPRQLMRV